MELAFNANRANLIGLAIAPMATIPVSIILVLILYPIPDGLFGFWTVLRSLGVAIGLGALVIGYVCAFLYGLPVMIFLENRQILNYFSVSVASMIPAGAITVLFEAGVHVSIFFVSYSVIAATTALYIRNRILDRSNKRMQADPAKLGR